jgi:hypothetical protein
VSAVAATEVVVEEFLPVADTVKPVLVVLGTGQLVRTASGIAVMVHTILVGTGQWRDAGALAWDNVDGNLTNSISASGLGAVDTSKALGAEVPYVITYSVRLSRRSTPGIRRRLVMLTLVVRTHVGKLYSASKLVLSLSASCSWDGG